MIHAAKKSQGFTLIELMLAMAFVSALLLGVAMTIIQIGSIYNRGMTLKDINQVSRDISDDLRRNVASTGGITLATDYVPYPDATSPTGGRLCLGTYSYIWNYAKAIEADKNITEYAQYPDGTKRNASTPKSVIIDNAVRFVKVADSGKAYCEKNDKGAIQRTNIPVDDVQVKGAKDMLKRGDHDLGIHQFVFGSSPASARDTTTGQQLYTINFTIGTSTTSALNTDQSACLSVAADKLNADPLYCSVQQFTLVVRAGNGVN